MQSSQMCDGHKMLNDSYQNGLCKHINRCVRQMWVSIKVNSVWQFTVIYHMLSCLIVKRREKGLLTVLGCPTPPHASISPPSFPNLPQDLPASPALPWAPRALLAKGSAGVGSLWLPRSCSFLSLLTQRLIYHSSVHLSLHLSVLLANAHPLVSLFDPLFLSLSLSPSPSTFSFSAPSLAQAVLGWRIDWGFYSPSLTSSLSFSLSLCFFCSPGYCNAQTSLICVFVSVYLLLS